MNNSYDFFLFIHLFYYFLGHHAPEPHYSHPPAQYHHTEPAHHISGHSHHSPSAGFGSGFSFPKGFGGDF